MKVCPACGNSYPDDANFCPMDASRLAVAAPPAEASPAPPDAIGGRFVVQGVGVPTPTGMVNDAVDLQGGAMVSLKRVPPQVLPSPTLSDRALRELKQLAKVTSARIARPLDQGRLPDGSLYIVTERVAGAVSLEELVTRQGPLELERARAIVLEVGEALTDAQKVGVIHRDVAPRNISIGPQGRVQLTDFGLAEPITEQVFGAPAYLSPEQAEGKPVDQRSNIYSLGAVYYFALTGQPPFAGDANSLLQQHRSAIAAPPSTRRPELPPELDRVVLKALEKSSGRRQLTLRQFLTEVATVASSKAPVRAGAHAKTVLGEAPVIAATQPARGGAAAQTMMGIPTPLQAVSLGAEQPASSAPTPLAANGAAVAPAAQGAPPSSTMGAPSGVASAPADQVAPSPAMGAPSASPMGAATGATTGAAEVPQVATPARVAEAATVMAEAPQVAGTPVGRLSNGTGKRAAFRETAWFKRGELEEEVAKAQAAADTSSDPLKTGTTGKQIPIDDSQVPLSAQDQARLSLKTGATQAMQAVKMPQQGLPGERMDEAEMLAEIAPTRRYLTLAGAVVVALGLGLGIYLATRPASRGGTGSGAPAQGTPRPTAASATTPQGVAATPEGPAAKRGAAAPTPAASKVAPALPAGKVAPAPPPAATGVAAGQEPAERAHAEAVAKLESARTVDRRQLRRLEEEISADLSRARKHKNRAAEATNRQLLARLHKLARKR